MSTISFQQVLADDKILIELIAGWYLREWKMPVEVTIQRLLNFKPDEIPFQMIMATDDAPVATGGLYNHVGLLDREPRFKIYGPWLALVYTTEENRNMGYGTLLCQKIQDISKSMGLKEIYLYTNTAEKLYKRLGWSAFERVTIQDRDIVVMKIEL